MQNHYFDDVNSMRPYTHSAPANTGTRPPKNATRGKKPEKKKGFWPCWNGKEWFQVKDLRGTAYYIRNSDGQVESVTIKEIGEQVPDDGHLNIDDVPLTLSEKTQAAVSKREGLLAATDWYVTRAAEPDGKPVPDDVLAYRRALREIDQHKNWPDLSDDEWPVLARNKTLLTV